MNNNLRGGALWCQEQAALYARWSMNQSMYADRARLQGMSAIWSAKARQCLGIE